jgi:diguanylate cyclase (GGDEF)-like protein/PAS domain S-box-containing protein
MGDRKAATDAWLAALAAQTNEAIATIDESGRISWANAAALTLLSVGHADVIGARIIDLIHPDDLDRALIAVTGVSNGAMPRPGLIRLRGGEGTWRLIEVSLSLIELDDEIPAPSRRLTMVVLRDNLLQEAHWNFFAAISTGASFADCIDGFARGMSNSTDGPLAITFDDGGHRGLAGDLPPLLAGIRADGVADDRPGTPWGDAVRSGAATARTIAELPADIAAAAHEIGAAACVVVPVPDPASSSPMLLIQWPPVEAMAPVLIEALVRRPRQAMVIALERRDAIRRLELLAHHDGLSGLANCERFMDAIAEMAGADRPYGVCDIDLDLFKSVNDSFGHPVGDAVIEAVGRRLKRLCRPGDLAARLGGDEFALVCPNVSAPTLESIAARIITALSAPIAVAEHVVEIGASVGCALSDGGSLTRTADEVVADADAALYRAKRGGRNRWSRADQLERRPSRTFHRSRQAATHQLGDEAFDEVERHA